MNPITPQPQYQAPISQRHFLNKKFIVTFVILILLGTAAYAGLWYWQNQQVANEVVPTFTPRPSVVADWKTFTSANSYSFNYPVDWTAKEEGAGYMTVTGTRYEPWEVTLSLYPITSVQTLDYYKNKFEKDLVFSHATKITFAGEPAWEGIDGGMTMSYSILVAHNKLMYRILVFAENKDQLSVEQKQILSTFKFTNIIDTSTWKTYTNTEYGIELKYPPTWIVQEKVAGSGFWIDPPDFKMLPSGTVNPYFVFDVTAHMYLGDEKPVIKMFGTRTGYIYVKDQSVYFPEKNVAGGYFIKHYNSLGVDEFNQILSTFKFTK